MRLAAITFDLETICGHRYDATSYHARCEVLLVLHAFGYVGAGEDDMVYHCKVAEIPSRLCVLLLYQRTLRVYAQPVYAGFV